MPHDRSSRPAHRHNARNRVRNRPATPENPLETHLQQLFEEQQQLHDMLVNHGAAAEAAMKALIPEDYDPDSAFEYDPDTDVEPEPGENEYQEKDQNEEQNVELNGEPNEDQNKDHNEVKKAEKGEQGEQDQEQVVGTETELESEPETEADSEPETDAEQDPYKDIDEAKAGSTEDLVDASDLLEFNEQDLQELDEQDLAVLAEDVIETAGIHRMEALPALPPRLFAYKKKAGMGHCTVPEVEGQGYDPPFMYPGFIGKSSECRAKYIFTMVDKLVEQMEHHVTLGDSSKTNPEPVDKPSTGAVPKIRPMGLSPRKSRTRGKAGRVKSADNVISGNDKETKSLSQSKYLQRERRHNSPWPLKEHFIQDPDLGYEIDLDCEFGMEHIQKFRANNALWSSPSATSASSAFETTSRENLQSDSCDCGSSHAENNALGSRDNGPRKPVRFKADNLPKHAASGGASRVASQSKVDKKPESTTYREELEKFNRYRETINRARMSPLEGYRLWRDEQNVEEHDKAQAMCKTTESGVMVPTRSCSPVQELPPGVRYLVEGRTAFSQIESPLSKPKVPPLDAPSTSTQARIIAARAKREKQKTLVAKYYRFRLSTARARARSIPEVIIKQAPVIPLVCEKNCEVLGPLPVAQMKHFVGVTNICKKVSEHALHCELDAASDHKIAPSVKYSVVKIPPRKRSAERHLSKKHSGKIHATEEDSAEEHSAGEHPFEEHSAKKHLTKKHSKIHSPKKHSTKKHATKKDPSEEHTSEEHPTGDHPTEEHSAKKHSTKKYSTKKDLSKRHPNPSKRHPTKKHPSRPEHGSKKDKAKRVEAAKKQRAYRMKILGNMERLLKRMPIQYPIPKSKWKLKWVTNWLHPKRRVKISFPQKPTTKPSDKSKTRHKRKKGVKPKPQTAPYDPFDKDLPEEAMEEMDRGQRLKYMLMDKERLRMQQKLQHLVPPADPLEAVVLPRFIHRQDVPGALIEAKRRIRQREDQRKIESASIFSEGETSSVAGGSTYETIGDSQLSMTDDIKSTASSEISSVSGMYQTNKVVKYVNGNYSEFSLWESDSFASQRPTPMLALPPLMTRAERSLPQKVSVKCIPPYGDFRAHIELDLCTQKALVWVSKTVSPEPLLEGQKCIQAYMEHFYWERLQKDSLNFHWFISEGILPCQYLIYEKTVEELDGLSHKKLDCQVLKYIGNVNKSDYPRQPCTDIMAYFMVTCYFRMLHKRATQKWRGTSDRFFLRSRFAVSLVETYCLENGVLFFKDNLHCNQLLEWCLMHEYRVRCLYREAEESSCERTRLHADAAMVIKTPNIEVFKDFYQRNVTPKPDALAINPCQKAIRPYPSSEAQRHEFYCPIQGCSAGLNFTLVMSHFIINHCRRVEELWLEDRMIIMFYPRTYPPTQLYCLCVMALQRRKPILNETVIIPRQIQNAELPPKMLFYADHFPCLLMYCQVDQRLLVKSLFNGKIESKWKSKGCEWLYVFWIATNRLTEHPNAACRLYVYCQDYSVKGNALLNFVDLAEFKGVEDLVIYHPDSYLAFDQKTMVALTKDFKELVFIDVRHVNRDNFDAEFSGDDTWDL